MKSKYLILATMMILVATFVSAAWVPSALWKDDGTYLNITRPRTINVTSQSIAADYFYGNGSFLTGVAASGGDTDTKWDISNSTYLVNLSGASTLDVDYDKLNKTINDSIDSKALLLSGGNLTGDLGLLDTISLFMGSGNDVRMSYSTGQTPDSLVLGLGSDSNSFIITETADASGDFAHPLQANPTVFIHNAHNDTSNWTSISHDGVDAVIDSGAGNNISMEDSVSVNGDLTVGTTNSTFQIWMNGSDIVIESLATAPLKLLTYSPNGTSYNCYVNNTGVWTCDSRE